MITRKELMANKSNKISNFRDVGNLLDLQELLLVSGGYNRSSLGNLTNTSYRIFTNAPGNSSSSPSGVPAGES